MGTRIGSKHARPIDEPRRALRRCSCLGYAVRIRRKSGPIALAEWTTFATAAPDLEPAGDADKTSGKVPLFRWKDAVLEWRDGQVVVDGMQDEWRRKLGEIAERLGGDAIGDDGERYLSDGRVDYGEGPESVQGIRTLAAFRYVPPQRESPWPKRIAIGVAVVVALALAAFAVTRGF